MHVAVACSHVVRLSGFELINTKESLSPWSKLSAEMLWNIITKKILFSSTSLWITIKCMCASACSCEATLCFASQTSDGWWSAQRKCIYCICLALYNRAHSFHSFSMLSFASVPHLYIFNTFKVSLFISNPILFYACLFLCAFESFLWSQVFNVKSFRHN